MVASCAPNVGQRSSRRTGPNGNMSCRGFIPLQNWGVYIILGRWRHPLSAAPTGPSLAEAHPSGGTQHRETRPEGRSNARKGGGGVWGGEGAWPQATELSASSVWQSRSTIYIYIYISRRRGGMATGYRAVSKLGVAEPQYNMEACCCPRADESNNFGFLGFLGFRYGGVLLPACGREQ